MSRIQQNPAEKPHSPQGDRVTDALRLAIHHHQIAPGTKLGEGELAEIYQVSRTIIRAALLSLAHQKLVEIVPNRGAFVARPTIKSAHEVFEARAQLEPTMAARAAERATRQDIEKLQAHIHEEHEALERGEVGTALHLSGLFHTEIARIADHEIFAAFIEELVAQSALIIALYWRRESALCEKHAHHALLSAIKAHQGEAAAELMKSHLIDLHSALDLREFRKPAPSLKEALLSNI